MNSNIQEAPLRLLLVEDSPQIRADLIQLIAEHFHNAKIDEAATVEEGARHLKGAYRNGAPYDCAILDLNLPLNMEAVPAPNTSLIDLVLPHLMDNPTSVILFTGFHEDGEVKRWQESHLCKSLQFLHVISKRDINSPTHILEHLEGLAANKVIGNVLSDPYFIAPNPGVHASRSTPSNRPPVNLPGFVQAVVDNWNLLSPDRHNAAFRAFRGSDWELEKTGEGVRVKDERTRRLLDDARENAEFLQEFTRQNRKS